MTETLIALISIIIGIAGANSVQLFSKKYSFDIIGNSIAGVFGSVFLIKSFGRLGFDPISIMQSGSLNIYLFCINILISLFGGIITVVLIKKMVFRISNNN